MIVLWRITERCNLACSFCAYDRRLQRPRRDADAARALHVGAQLGALRQHTGERVLLSWLGGEPLLWRPLFDVSRRLRHEHGIELSATTNGTTLHLPATVSHVLDLFSELTVSVDGLQAFHDQVRGSAGAWLRLRSAVCALTQARSERGAALRLRVNVVLMRDNVGEFAALCEQLASWGVDEITFNALGGRDRPEFFPRHRLRAHDVAALRGVLHALQPSLAARGVRLCASAAYLRRIDAGAHDVPVAVADCRPGERFFFIDESGRVSPCSFTSQAYGVDVDSLAHWRGWLALPATFRAARAEQRAAPCDDCRATHVFEKFDTFETFETTQTVEPAR